MRLEKELKKKTIEGLRAHETDTGSPEVQVGIITEKIKNLTEHLKIHKKDHSSRRGLIQLVGRRSSFLKYLLRNDKDRHRALITKLKIRG